MIKTKIIEVDKGKISFLDYTINESEMSDSQVFPKKLGLKVFTIEVNLDKNLSELDEEKEFLEEVNKYVKIDEDIKFTDNSRRNLSKLITAGSKVAMEGRRGPAHHVLIYRPTFKKLLSQEDRDYLQRLYKVWFSKEKLDYVLVWREGADDEPGCILVKNDEKYTFTSLGLHPECQFVKINVE